MAKMSPQASRSSNHWLTAAALMGQKAKTVSGESDG
jgi:hypothetical protein